MMYYSCIKYKKFMSREPKFNNPPYQMSDNFMTPPPTKVVQDFMTPPAVKLCPPTPIINDSSLSTFADSVFHVWRENCIYIIVE